MRKAERPSSLPFCAKLGKEKTRIIFLFFAFSRLILLCWEWDGDGDPLTDRRRRRRRRRRRDLGLDFHASDLFFFSATAIKKEEEGNKRLPPSSDSSRHATESESPGKERKRRLIFVCFFCWSNMERVSHRKTFCHEGIAYRYHFCTFSLSQTGSLRMVQSIFTSSFYYKLSFLSPLPSP